MDQVAPANPGSVEEVIAFTIALNTAFDGDFVVVDWQPAGGIVEHDGDLGEGRPRPALASDIDDLLHLPAPQVASLA